MVPNGAEVQSQLFSPEGPLLAHLPVGPAAGSLLLHKVPRAPLLPQGFIINMFSSLYHVLFLRTAFQPVAGVRVSGVLASLNLSSLINKMNL